MGLESKTLQEVLDYLGNEVGGDWLLTGGSLVRLKFDANRGTEDMDLMRIRHSDLSDEASRNMLFSWLIKRGLGPEWVNTAVEPFVREVSEWEQNLVLFQGHKKGSIYRPNLTLFIYLKLRRGTEVDLEDIRKAIPACPEGYDERKLMSWADQKLKKKYSDLKAKLGL